MIIIQQAFSISGMVIDKWWFLLILIFFVYFSSGKPISLLKSVI
jgi:hypothetical protein